jgi:hypothetical protein
MRIKLVGALSRDLKDLKLKPGDKFEAYPAENTNLAAVQVKLMVDGSPTIATIYPENFVKI